ERKGVERLRSIDLLAPGVVANLFEFERQRCVQFRRFLVDLQQLFDRVLEGNERRIGAALAMRPAEIAQVGGSADPGRPDDVDEIARVLLGDRKEFAQRQASLIPIECHDSSRSEFRRAGEKERTALPYITITRVYSRRSVLVKGPPHKNRLAP